MFELGATYRTAGPSSAGHIFRPTRTYDCDAPTVTAGCTIGIEPIASISCIQGSPPPYEVAQSWQALAPPADKPWAPLDRAPPPLTHTEYEDLVQAHARRIPRHPSPPTTCSSTPAQGPITSRRCINGAPRPGTIFRRAPQVVSGSLRNDAY